MFSTQKVTIAGRVVHPTLRESRNGTSVFSFSVPVEEGRKTEDGWENKTCWFRVTVFGNYAETLARNLGEGGKVVVTGKLSFDEETGGPRIWEDKDGNPRASFEIISGGFNGDVTILDNGDTDDIVQDTAGEEFDDLPW